MSLSPTLLKIASLRGLMVEGIANTGKLDLTRERVMIGSLDFGPLRDGGVFNYDHRKGTYLGDIIHAETVPDGMGGNLLKVVGVLDPDNPDCQEILRDLANNVPWGLSVEGDRGKAVGNADGTTDLHHAVTWAVAITRNPCDPRTSLSLMKSGTFGGTLALYKSDEATTPAVAPQDSYLTPTLRENLQGSSDRWGRCKAGQACPKRGWKNIKQHLVKCVGMTPATAQQTVAGMLDDLRNLS